ncbi:MAG: DUF3450 domain-containing protein [Gammaproteobacteria bacterium]|nr:DUF3450 domain-containing protein [Gammaproteobacteria bacterium]
MNLISSMRHAIPILAFCAVTLHLPPAGADPVTKTLSRGEDNIRREQHTQKSIDQLSDETQIMLGEYQTLSRELDGLTVYNDQMQRLVTSQEEEKLLIAQQIEDIDFTRQQIVPLMLRMISQLDTFVSTDSPFLLPERTRRVQQLTDLMDRSDVTLAEKYRRILEAYQIELDYSRTLEAYQDEVEAGGVLRTVDVLRVGRTGLYYQTLDRQSAAYWDHQQQVWVDTEAAQRRTIQRGLRIASQQLAPELLELPVAAAGDGDE